MSMSRHSDCLLISISTCINVQLLKELNTKLEIFAINICLLRRHSNSVYDLMQVTYGSHKLCRSLIFIERRNICKHSTPYGVEQQV